MPVPEMPFRCQHCAFKSVVLRDCLHHFSKEHPDLDLRLKVPVWDANDNQKTVSRTWGFIPSTQDCSSIVKTDKDADVIQENLCLSLVELMQEGHENEVLTNFFELTDYVKYSTDTVCLFYVLEMWHSDKKLEMCIDGEATAYFRKTYPNGLTPIIRDPSEVNGNDGDDSKPKS